MEWKAWTFSLRLELPELFQSWQENSIFEEHITRYEFHKETYNLVLVQIFLAFWQVTNGTDI